MSKERCAACRYWEEDAENGYGVAFGQCRRYPPNHNPGRTSDYGAEERAKLGPSANFECPFTSEGDWCGEFKTRDEGSRRPWNITISSASPGVQVMASHPMEVAMQTSVMDLGLTMRAANCLRAHNIYTVGEIYAYGQILKIPNMGPKLAAEISEALVRKGWEPVYEDPRVLRAKARERIARERLAGGAA